MEVKSAFHLEAILESHVSRSALRAALWMSPGDGHVVLLVHTRRIFLAELLGLCCRHQLLSRVCSHLRPVHVLGTPRLR